MNTISRTALSNFKKNKSRNLLIGAAIALTAFLLTAAPTVMIGFVKIQSQAVNQCYPAFHAMLRSVDSRTARQILADERVGQAALRKDGAAVYEEQEPHVQVTMLPAGQAAAELSGHGERDRYRMYLGLAGTDGMTTDAIQEEAEALAEQYGIEKNAVVLNREYLAANYVDPSMYSGLGMILAMIALVGAMTIYGIYYVSMLDKVQEYGRLRAVGATKRQIRQLVFREGLAVAAAAIPIGVLLGLLAGVQMIRAAAKYSMGSDSALSVQMKQIAENGGVNLIQPWIIGFSILISLATVCLSLRKPMRTAARITPMEALRYQGEEKNVGGRTGGERKKSAGRLPFLRKNRNASGKMRKGYEEISIRRLTFINLTRNKKRTAMTIFTLGATGILFMAAATVCSSMDPEDMARDELRADIRISLDAWEHPMYPERALNRIQQDNPLTEELKEQILEIDGVTDIEVDTCVTARVEGPTEADGSPLQSAVTGVGRQALEALRDYVAEGSLDDPSLMDGTGIILGGQFRDRFDEMKDWKPGKRIQMELLDGEKTRSVSVQVAAVVNGPRSLGGTWFAMPADALQGLCETDLTDCFEVTVEPGMEDQAAESIRLLTADLEYLEMKVYSEVYQEAENSVSMLLYVCYGMLLIFGLIGILNLINTMINSVYVRRRELGMLQAVGMSGRQTVHMLQMEGLFYTLGTIVLSLGLGSLSGYGAFLWAKKNGIFSIVAYRYPAAPAAALIFAVLAVQLLVTCLVDRSFKKESLVDRVRFAQ